jgi:hypothetical protein
MSILVFKMPALLLKENFKNACPPADSHPTHPTHPLGITGKIK